MWVIIYMIVNPEEIHRLSLSENTDDKFAALELLREQFEFLADKSSAWEDLHRLVNDKNLRVKVSATFVLGSVFKYAPNKLKAWDDLHSLTFNEYSDIRENVTYALGSVFQYSPYRSAAWDDLHRLTNDESLCVREKAADVFGHVYPFIADKYEALDVFHRLTNDSSWIIRHQVARSLGFTFSFLPEEYMPIVLADLQRLTDDSNLYVRPCAYYSLGRICIYKASKSKDEADAQKILEDAINYFDNAVLEGNYIDIVVGNYNNPAKFCRFFYRSFDAVLFKKASSRKEIGYYITAAKNEIRDSKSKTKLLQAVEQLAEVLETAQKAKKLGIRHQELFEHCSSICTHIDRLMDENKNKTPAINDLYNIARPSFKKNIKVLIDEVKEKIDIACKEAKGTPAEAIVYPVKKEIQEWEVEDQELMAMNLDLVVLFLKSKIPKISDNTEIIDKIDQIKSYLRVEIQMGLLASIISSLPHVNIPKQINEFKEEMNNRFDKIEESQHRIDLSLDKINQRLDNNYDKLRTLSFDFKRRDKEIESDHIDTFEKEIRSLIAERDYETLDFFAKKLAEDRPSLFEENDESDASDEDKIKGEKSIFELRSLPHKIKEIMISSTTDVSKEVVVSLIANLIIESVFPILGPASFQVVKILVSAIRSRKNATNSTKIS